MKLNIGCGDKKLAGYVNVDLCGEPDICCDLSVFPWPFEDNSADEITSSHFLEHVQDYEKTILEIHRILKPGGNVRFKVPHFRCPLASWHLHKWQFSTCTFDLLCIRCAYQWGGRRLFEKINLRVNYIFISAFFGRILSFLANLSPGKWDYLGLPIDEVEFIGRKV